MNRRHTLRARNDAKIKEQFDSRAAANRAAHADRRERSRVKAAAGVNHAASRMKHRAETNAKAAQRGARDQAARLQQARARRDVIDTQKNTKQTRYRKASNEHERANAARREVREGIAARRNVIDAAHDARQRTRASNLRAIRDETRAKYDVRKARDEALLQNRSDALRARRNGSEMKEAKRIARLGREQRIREQALREKRDQEKEEKERNFRDNVEERMKRAEAAVAHAASAVSKVHLGHASAGGCVWGPGYHTRRERLEDERAVREERLQKNIDVREKGRMKGLKKIRRRKEKRARMESARAEMKLRTHSEALREKRLARVKREQAYLDAKLEEEATRAALLTTLIHPTKKKIDSRVALQAAHLDQHLAEREIGLKEKAAKAKAVAEEIDRTKAKEEAVRHAALLVSKGRRVKGSYKHPLGAATTATLTRPIMSGGMVETYRKAAGNEANEAVKQAGLKQMWDRKEYLAKKEIKKEDAAIRVKEEGIRRKITVKEEKRQARLDHEERNRQLAEEQRRIHRSAKALRDEERRAWGKAADLEREAAIRRLVAKRRARLEKLAVGDPAQLSLKAPRGNGPTAAGRRRLRGRMTVMELKRQREAAQEQAKFNQWGDEAFPETGGWR